MSCGVLRHEPFQVGTDQDIAYIWRWQFVIFRIVFSLIQNKVDLCC